MSSVSARLMPQAFVFCALLAGCITFGPQAPPSSPPRAPREAPAPPAPLAAHPVPVRRTPCALKPVSQGKPACSFVALPDAARGPVLRVERNTCQLAREPHFVGVDDVPTLSLLLSIVEGNTSFTLPFLRRVDGEVRPLPGELREAMMVGGALVGIASDGKDWAFWRDGVCEAPASGPVVALAPLGKDEVVALVQTWDRGREVLRRDALGHWSTWGTVPRGVEPRFSAADGQVVLHAETLGVPWEYSALFPDLARTEVVKRAEGQRAVMPSPSIAPLPPRDGSRFSSGVYAELDDARTLLLVDRPTPGSGHRRVAVAALETLPGCGKGKEGRFRFLEYSAPAVTLLGDDTALVAVVEQRGECEAAVHQPPPPQCGKGQPCRQAPPEWGVTELHREVELVLYAVGGAGRELLRLPLGDGKRTERTFTGVSLAVTADRVYAYAAGHLVALDRAALEAR